METRNRLRFPAFVVGPLMLALVACGDPSASVPDAGAAPDDAGASPDDAGASTDADVHDAADAAPVDPCTIANGGCAQTCSSEGGGVTCGCTPGYALSGDGMQCAPDCTALSCLETDICMVSGSTPVCVCDPTMRPPRHGGTASAGPGTTEANAADAFDGDPMWTQFNAIVPDVNWLMYDYGPDASPVIAGYTLHANALIGEATIAFALEGSHDGVTFTTLDSRAQQLVIYSGPFVFRVANTTGYRYYRLRFPGLADNAVRVQELLLNDCALD